jgi:shikimate 5-dehydrogenase
MSERLKEFREFRERLNARIHESGNLDIKRFFALDSRAYEAGALPVKTKEMMGLVVGGSITIPHLRRAVAMLDEVEAMA